MPPLDRAVRSAEVDDVAVRIREHLHLDVAGIVEVPLDIDRRVREVRLAFAARRRERAFDLVRGTNHLQSLAAAPADAFTASG